LAGLTARGVQRSAGLGNQLLLRITPEDAERGRRGWADAPSNPLRIVSALGGAACLRNRCIVGVC
jgi:hypothetical protein